MQLALRRRLLASTVLIGASMLGTAAFAQTGATNNATSDQTASAGVQSAASAADEGTIVVTGSLITNPNLTRSTPVNVTTSEEVELRQTNVAEQLLREIPGVVPSIGSAVNNGNGGASYVDLRGLGSIRNIVLLDGNRIVPAGLAGRVDLNNIPLALIERTEVLTGGASTTYGADAVSGVVNFITKRDFAGVEIQSSEQITERGDGNVFRTDVTLGANFDDGRGNAVFSIGYQEADPVYQGDRDYARDQIESFTGGLGGSGTSTPSRFTGTRPIDPATGLPSTDPAVANGPARQINPATGVAVPTFHLYNFNPFNIFQTPFKRYNMFGQASYKIADSVEVYTRGLFSKNRVDTIIAPSGAFGPAIPINLNNPYLPAALAQQFCAFDVDPRAQFYQPRFTPAQCTAAINAAGPGSAGYAVIGAGNVQPSSALVNGAYDVNKDGVIDAKDRVDLNPAVTVSRRTPELGPRISDFQTTVFDYRLGVRGDITDSIRYDVSGAYGESENIQTIQNYALTSRFRQAALASRDANGNIVCNDPSNGCVPVNLFGPEGSISAAQAKFLTATSTTSVRTSLAQARGVVNGDFGVALPWANDAINFAIGGEYRHYTASQRSDTLAKTPGELGGAGGAAPDIQGGFDVYEAFGELVAPLVQDKPFFKELTLEAGVRYSHYTINAPGTPKFNTTTWKAQGTWEPVDGIKIRGGYSHAVRAPNISELFTPVTTVLTALATDPCASVDNKGVRLRPAPVPGTSLYNVCIAQGATAGNIGSINVPTAGQANITTGGNTNLKPEKSNSFTIGAVLQPDFVPGLAVSVDYYNIKIKNAITTPTTGDLVAACFGAADANGNYNPAAGAAASTACTVIRRNPTTGALDGDSATTPGLFALVSNQGSLATDGIDLTVNYNTDLGFAKLALSFAGNWTDHSRFKAIAASPLSVNRDCVGFYSTNCASIQPDFSWTSRATLSVDKVDLSLLWRHISAVRQEPQAILDGDQPPAYVGPYVNSLGQNFGIRDFGHIPAYDYFDLAARFGVSDNMTLTLTVNNLFDIAPPITGQDIGTAAFNSGNTYPSTYDPLGRTFRVGARLKF